MLKDIESQLHLDRESHREEIDMLQDQLSEERRIKEETEQDLLKQKKVSKPESSFCFWFTCLSSEGT